MTPTVVLFVIYGVVGTCERVNEIKARAPADIEDRGWDILRHEGWQYGSFQTHGGRVWYHVANKDNHNIQYRVQVILWGDELHYIYGDPEKLNRFDVNLSDD